MKDEDPDRHIAYLGIGTESGWSEMLMAEEVTRQLQLPEGDRYYVRGRDGWEAEVKLGRCQFCARHHEFLRTAPDLTARDKLLTLPQCGEP